MAKRILPILQAFRKADKNGYPMYFCNWAGEKDHFDEKDEPEFVGGQMEGWNAALDKMIYAFEWQLYSDEMLEFTKNKKAKEWLKKNGDPYATKDPSNYHKFVINDQEEGYFYDEVLAKKLKERADEGFKLFSKYYLNLWD